MIDINQKYGCLTVLDMGQEYELTDLYSTALMELEELEASSEPKNGYLAKAHKDRVKALLEKHYKCKCKCGKIHFFNEKTIESNPRYCFYPVSLANLQFSYSNKAKNANYEKRQKYAGIENVRLWEKPPAGRPDYFDYDFSSGKKKEYVDYSLPSDEYCELYNKHKTRELLKSEQRLSEEISKIPRVNAENFDIEFSGRQYESLFIEECVNDHLESEPKYHFTQQHKKLWNRIIVYKQYRCKCLLCGKEMLVNCDRFGIYPPTEYGYHAYFGYWSNVVCECRENISSFQWIVNKLLFENHILYRVEVSFPDLYGIHGENLLRFDFAVIDNDGNIQTLIECQGEQHYKPVEEFGGIRQYEDQVRNDALKRAYASNHNIPLIEISYKQKRYEDVRSILESNGVI